MEGGATGPDLADPKLLRPAAATCVPKKISYNLFIYLYSFAGIVAHYSRLCLRRRPKPLQVRPSDGFVLPGSEFLVHQLLSRARSDLSCFDPILDGRQFPGGGRIRSVTAAASSSAAAFTPACFGWVLFIFILHPTDEAVL